MNSMKLPVFVSPDLDEELTILTIPAAVAVKPIWNGLPLSEFDIDKQVNSYNVIGYRDGVTIYDVGFTGSPLLPPEFRVKHSDTLFRQSCTDAIITIATALGS